MISLRRRLTIAIAACGCLILTGFTAHGAGKNWGSKHMVDIGAGIGLDYGGLAGANVAYMPIPWLSVFASGGYYMTAPGWQTGVVVNVLPKTTRYVYRPSVKIMYGTNAQIQFLVDNGSGNIERVYLGPTIGFGNQLRFGSRKRHGFDVDINFPIRSHQFWDDVDTVHVRLKQPGTDSESPDDFPVAVSVGYHFEF